MMVKSLSRKETKRERAVHKERERERERELFIKRERERERERVKDNYCPFMMVF